MLSDVMLSDGSENAGNKLNQDHNVKKLYFFILVTYDFHTIK